MQQTAPSGEVRSINIRSVCLFSLYDRKIQSNLRRSNSSSGGDRRRRPSLLPSRVVIERTIGSAFFVLNLLHPSGGWCLPDRVPTARSPVLSRFDRPGLWRRRVADAPEDRPVTAVMAFSTSFLLSRR